MRFRRYDLLHDVQTPQRELVGSVFLRKNVFWHLPNPRIKQIQQMLITIHFIIYTSKKSNSTHIDKRRQHQLNTPSIFQPTSPTPSWTSPFCNLKSACIDNFDFDSKIITNKEATRFDTWLTPLPASTTLPRPRSKKFTKKSKFQDLMSFSSRPWRWGTSRQQQHNFAHFTTERSWRAVIKTSIAAGAWNLRGRIKDDYDDDGDVQCTESS